ncbi:CCG7 protein, partial [Edolisoma coerulescens]|nr:CCG7 protein [Edolisoma coerulescens]
MSSCSSRALTLLSSVFGACGLLLVGIAVSTDYWLYMEEGVVSPQNQSTEVRMALHAGLWRVCFFAGNPETPRGVPAKNLGVPNPPLKSSFPPKIPSKILVSPPPFPTSSRIFSQIFPKFSPNPPKIPRIFSPAGLSLVVGLVLYISSINDEVMNRPGGSEQYFQYRYGWSFAFAASSFLLKE